MEDELIPDFDCLSDEDLDQALSHSNGKLEKIKKALCYAKILLNSLAHFS